MAKRALITGITGQDGSYLAELLLEKGYEVFGVVRRLSAPNDWRIDHLRDRVTLCPGDLLDQLSIIRLLDKHKPDEFYNLAAMSFVPASWDTPLLTGEFNSQGVTRVLDAIRTVNPKIKFYQASSSEMFGKVREIPQTENDAVLPAQPVRRVEGVRALHHGELSRELRSLCRVGHSLQPRVAAARARIRDAQGHRRRGAHQARARRFAGARQSRRAVATGVLPGDYVRAMWLMLQQPTADDYVIATGVSHSVRELVEIAFARVGLDWQKYVKTDPKFLRPAEVDHLIGNPAKAKKVLGWEPKVDFKQLVEMMVDADLERLSSRTTIPSGIA